MVFRLIDNAESTVEYCYVEVRNDISPQDFQFEIDNIKSKMTDEEWKNYTVSEILDKLPKEVEWHYIEGYNIKI